MSTIDLLVVDDNLANRLLPGLMLRKEGHQVTDCETGEQALAHLRLHRYTHLLLDISLPRVSGLEICRIIRSWDDMADLQVIAYTAHALPQETREMLAAGFDRVLVKPIRRQDLLDVLGAG